MFSPTDLLLPYQKKMRQIANSNRLTFFLCSRQVGKSFLLAFLAVERAWTNPNSKIVILSSGERAALEVLDKVKKIAKIFRTAFCDTPANFNIDITSMEVRLSNNSKIITLPSGDPDKVRGFSPILTICDEFSTLERQEELYRGIFPSITSPFGGEKSLIVSGTPIGRSNLFWRLWEEKNDYAKYCLTIYDAKDQGLNVDIETLKRNVPDEESFRQEFLCEPLDSNVSLFSYDFLNQCTYSETMPNAIRRYFGIDIGRMHDKTAIAILAVCPDGSTYIDEIKVLSNMEFRQQFAEISSLIRALKPKMVSVDRTGIGMQIAEDLQTDFGMMIDELTFTNQSKVEIFNNLKKAFSEGTSKIPDEPDLIKEFNSIRRVVNANSITYQADRDNSGHADRATACALAYRAFLLDTQSVDFMPFTL